MKEQIDVERFRRDFKHLDDAVLLSVAHVAALASQTVAAVYVMKHRRQLPPPAIARGKMVRWTAGQIRAWVAELAGEAFENGDKRKIGRPRFQAAPQIKRAAPSDAVDQVEP